MTRRPRPLRLRRAAALLLAAAGCGDAGADTSGGDASASTSEVTTTSTTTTATTTSASTTTTGPIESTDAYSFFAPLTGTATYLIDRDAALVHAWESATRPGVAAFLLPDGDLLRTGITGTRFNFAGAGGLIERQSWDGALRWSFTYSDDAHRQHHDIEPLPNGHVLIVAWEQRSVAEATAAGRDPATIDQVRGLWPDTIVELDPEAGTIVWEWRVWDHLIQDFAADLANYGDPAAYPERIDLNHVGGTVGNLADWNHVNGIDYHPELDQILISAHQFNEIWIIDHATTTAEAAGHSGGARGRGGDLLYRWGNPAAYRSGSAGDRQLFHQHDPRWIRPGHPGAGDITIFNNGDPVIQPWSTVVQITPPLADDGAYTRSGAAFGPEAPTWAYVADPPESFYSQIVGGAQRLADGRTLITEGDIGRVFEVDPDGAIRWEYVHGGGVFRVDRFTADDPALAGRELTPMGPVPP